MTRSAILIFLLTFGLAKSNAQSQNVFPSYGDSATWHVLDCYAWNDCQTYVKTFEGEIDLCGHSYSVATFLTGDTGYFRSDSLRTYVRRTQNCADKEYLLYDFSMEIGDTVYVGFKLWDLSSDDSLGLKLQNIDTITQFGVSRRRFNMRSGPNVWNLSMAWIEGIGSDINPFYPFLCLEQYCESDHFTLCFDSAGTQLYQHPDYDTCSYTYTGIDEIEPTLDITISPNPFTHSFQINSDARIRDVEVYSILGEMIGRFEGKEDAMVVELPQHLSAGMYVVHIRTNQGILSKKVFKTSP
jgi:hypothetical protein